MISLSGSLRSAAAVLAALLIHGGADAAPAVLWSIGENNQTGVELKGFGHYLDIGRTIGSQPAFRIGTAKAADWPFVHPGPADQWGGATTHPLTIEFHLDAVPQGRCALLVDIVGAHRDRPPTLQVDINGSALEAHLPGLTPETALSGEAEKAPRTERFEFSPALLLPGTNRVCLAVTKGAWLLYDSIRLENDPANPLPPARLTDLRATTRLVHGRTAPEQLLVLGTEGYEKQADGILEVRRGTDTPSTRKVSVAFGRAEVPVTVPEVGKPTSVTVTLKCGTHVSQREILLQKPRHWTVHICPSVHTDIGYTGYQPLTAERHNLNTDTVIEMCRRNPQLQWNAEVAWQAENYAEHRSPDQMLELVSLMKSGRMELTACYLNFLTALMSDEGMNRLCYHAAHLNRRDAIPFVSGLITDVPTVTWSIVPALADSGVRYFAEGCNQGRGPMLTKSGIREPFYWEGPDGSRVLTWFTHSYAQSTWLSGARTLDEVGRHIDSALQGYIDAGYPFDVVKLYGAALDNCPVHETYDDLVADWNARYASPTLRLSTVTGFFTELEKRHGKELKVRRGDCGAYWEDGAGSTARETAIHRGNQQAILAAETLWSLAGLSGAAAPYPFDRIEKAWKDVLFYDEHTWGAAGSISAPDSRETREQWEYKAAFATRPAAEIAHMVTEGLAAYADRVPARKGEIVVANTLSWPRGGCVELPAECAEAAALEDDRGNPVPVQEHDGRRFAWVDDVPGFGSRVLRPAAASGRPAAADADRAANSITGTHYTVKWEDGRGIVSIVDRASGTELVDRASPHGFGQIVYASGGNDTRMIDFQQERPEPLFRECAAGEDPLKPPKATVLVSRAKIDSVTVGSCGPLFSEIVMQSSAPSMPGVRTSVRAWNTDKRLSVEVRITSKTEIREKEAVYVAFPFASAKPRFKLGLTNSVADPQSDFMPGACHDWYCVQNFVSCAVNDDLQVIWSPVDTPLLTLCDINRGRWAPSPNITNGTLFSYAMNNYWYTNYKAGQGGDFVFRYELTSAGRDAGGAACERFGRGVRSPLYARPSSGGGAGGAASVAVGGGAVGVTLKRAQDANGTILRLRNPGASPVTATVACGAPGLAVAQLCNRVEQPIEPLTVSGGKVLVPLKPQQTATVRLVREGK